MHSSLVMLSVVYLTGKVREAVSGGLTVRSSGAQPTKAKPWDVMSVYGRGLLLAVEVAVEDVDVLVAKVVDDGIDVDRMLLLLLPPLLPAGTMTKVTLMQNLFGSFSKL
jgi:hypothetical protein